MSNDVVKTAVVGESPISVGRFTYVADKLSIKQWNEGAALRIGAFCSLAENITIFLGGNHRTDWTTTYPFGLMFQDELGSEAVPGSPATDGDVVIGSDVWIGAGVTIMSGINIGDGAVIAANACVVKDVLPYQIAGGNPARHIKQRFDDETIDLLLRLKWWELPVPEIKKISKKLCAAPDKDFLLGLIDAYRK
jgi:acetyltransferase-like isoleucine patch superfamily enzyme